MKLEKKVALITGAGSGFGKAAAILFAKEGAKIIVVDIDSKTGNQTVDLIRREGYEASFVQADVSKSSDSEKMIKFAMDKYGRLDILFNNAGIPMPMTLVENVDEALWDKIMSVNVKSVFLASKIAIPIMKKQGGGVIINTSSAAGVKVRRGYCAYASSKAAVTHLTKTLALETAPFKIRVNSLSPVAAETAMMEGFFNEEMKKNFEATRQATLATIPIGRYAEAEDVARAALYLASDDSSMVTGINFLVDGGYTI
jgi:3-oxoacyl-[acyl-carrier protein] reductase